MTEYLIICCICKSFYIFRTKTSIIEVQTPCLDVVLGELGVGEEHHGVGEQLHVALRELLELEVHPADLGVEGVEVEQVGAVELLVVGLVHRQQVLITLEYLNLELNINKYGKTMMWVLLTSSATSGPLLTRVATNILIIRIIIINSE